MRSICLCFFLLIPSVLLDGTPRNYNGMTRSEVATVLEKEAFRSRWSGNRFLIVDIPRHSGFHYLRIAQDVLVNETLMKTPSGIVIFIRNGTGCSAGMGCLPVGVFSDCFSKMTKSSARPPRRITTGSTDMPGNHRIRSIRKTFTKSVMRSIVPDSPMRMKYIPCIHSNASKAC